MTNVRNMKRQPIVINLANGETLHLLSREKKTIESSAVSAELKSLARKGFVRLTDQPAMAW